MHRSCHHAHPLCSFVQEVGPDGAWIVFSPTCRGRCHVLDAADDPALLQAWPHGVAVGQRVQCIVKHVTATTLDVGMRGGGQDIADVAEGSTVMGRIKAVEGNGVVVQLGPRTVGKVWMCSRPSSVLDVHPDASVTLSWYHNTGCG